MLCGSLEFAYALVKLPGVWVYNDENDSSQPIYPVWYIYIRVESGNNCQNVEIPLDALIPMIDQVIMMRQMVHSKLPTGRFALTFYFDSVSVEIRAEFV
jgi:hypothetical protein